MKTTGIVRKIDELGRIVLPKSIREILEIREKDPVEISIDGNKVILTKYQPSCIFCGSSDNVISYCDKRICEECIEKIKGTL